MTEAIFCGTQEQWNAIAISQQNECLTNADLQLHDYKNGNCIYTIDRSAADVNGDGKVNLQDALLLLKRANGNKDPFPAEK